MKFGKDKNDKMDAMQDQDEKAIKSTEADNDADAHKDAAKDAEANRKAQLDDAAKRFDDQADAARQKAQDKADMGNDKTTADPKGSYVIKNVDDTEIKTEVSDPVRDNVNFVNPDAHAMSVTANRSDLKAVPAAPTQALRELPSGVEVESVATRDRREALKSNLEGLRKKIADAVADGRMTLKLDYALSPRELDMLRADGYHAAAFDDGLGKGHTDISWDK